MSERARLVYLSALLAQPRVMKYVPDRSIIVTVKRTERCPQCQASVGALDYLPERGREQSYQALGVMDYVPLYPTIASSSSNKPRMKTPRELSKEKAKAKRQGRALVTKAATVEALVCSGCGLLEQYVQDPHWVREELANLNGFAWLEGEGPMKRVACPKCHSSRRGSLSWLPDTYAGEGEVTARYLGIARGDSSERLGLLGAVVCADCGYIETYVHDVRRIELERIDGFHWLNEKDDGPYR